VRETFEAALRDLQELGLRVVDVEPPPGFERFRLWHRVRYAETEAVHRRWFPSAADSYGDDVRRTLEVGAGLTAAEYLEAVEVRRQMTDGFLHLLDEVDVLATPTAPFVATPIGQDWVDLEGGREPLLPALLRYATLAGCIGAPAVSLPCGFVDGLPAGLQLVARPFAESLLLGLGRAYEALHGWHLRLPPSC
jgi:aspartyl-tRNA(Asn)/glutamyl-tRNA(Gln) amidotransferase subunit A